MVIWFSWNIAYSWKLNSVRLWNCSFPFPHLPWHNAKYWPSHSLEIMLWKQRGTQFGSVIGCFHYYIICIIFWNVTVMLIMQQQHVFTQVDFPAKWACDLHILMVTLGRSVVSVLTLHVATHFVTPYPHFFPFSALPLSHHSAVSLPTHCTIITSTCYRFYWLVKQTANTEIPQHNGLTAYASRIFMPSVMQHAYDLGACQKILTQ